MNTRKATPNDIDNIFMLGFDVWSEGAPVEKYLEGFRRSAKYARGQWWVIEHPENKIASALITYQLSSDSIGIGSLCTPPELRRQGFASLLLEKVLGNFSGISTFYLWSDIKPEFYTRFGFEPLPALYQPHKGTVCMIKTPKLLNLLNSKGFEPPKYF